MTDAIPVTDASDLFIVVVSAGAAIIGGVVAILGQWFIEWRRSAPQRKLDKQRKEYLKLMLDSLGPERWHHRETLARVIGATKEDTARLLIELGARGNRQSNDVWAYIKHHPLSDASPGELPESNR